MVYKNIAKFLIMYFNKKVWYYDNIMDIRNTYKELKLLPLVYQSFLLFEILEIPIRNWNGSFQTK